MVACPCVINLSLWWDFTVFPTTVTDSSLALWMTPYQFSPPRVQILHIRFGWRLTFPLLWYLFSNRHSERWQACLVGKTGNGMVKRSKGSMTLMTSYRFPHHGNRFFAVAQNDALPWVLLYRQAWKWLESQLCRLFNVILNGGKNVLWEGRETERWNGVKNLLLW